MNKHNQLHEQRLRNSVFSSSHGSASVIQFTGARPSGRATEEAKTIEKNNSTSVYAN